MKTSILINNAIREFALTQIDIGIKLTESLKERGYDGTCWFGLAPVIGKHTERNAMFYRRTDGNFELVF